MLSEGYTIYNGPPNEIKNFLSGISIQMPPFTNPADFLIRLAVNPNLV